MSGRDDRSRELNLRRISLVLRRDDGSSVEITLLRDPAWIADYGAHVGGTVLLDLPEMAAVGPAEVLAIDDSPRIDQGPGQLITGTFHHTAAEVYNLKVESERELLGVTGTHPFWSVDRRAWVAAADLEIGETLKTLDGTTVVESIEQRPEPEPVCNIEVERDHVYRVGTSGVLVHNASPQVPANCKCTNAKNVTKRVKGPGGRFEVDADVVDGTENDDNPEVCKIYSIHGPLKKMTGRGGATAQSRMIAFLLGGDSSTYAAGHIVGDNLGGPNSTWNLVPMAHVFNNGGGWKSMEIRIAACLQSPSVKSMSLNVSLTYPPSGMKRFVPESISVTPTINRHRKKTIEFSDTSKRDSQVFKGQSCISSWV